MPRAVDKRPQARGLGNALYNPTRSGIPSWEDPYSAIDDTAAATGGEAHEVVVQRPRFSLANLFAAWFNIAPDDPNQPEGTPAEMWDLGLSIRESYTLNTAAITSLQEVAAAMNTTVSYVGDDDQMVSVLRSLLTIPTIGGSSTPPKSRNLLDPVEFVYSGVYHHAVPSVIRPSVVIGATEGDIIYTPITSDRKGLVEGIAWMGGADTSIFSIDHYFLSLCVIDVAANSIVKVWDSGDIKDAEAAVNNARPGELYKAIDTEQITAPGQILFAAHQQIAPGGLQTARTIGAAPASNIEKASAVRQAGKGWCLIAPAHSQGIPSTISIDSLVLENRYIPWFGLRVSAIPEPDPAPEPEPPPEEP